ARRNDIAIRVVAQVRIAGVIDEVVGIGDEADVHGAENLVEVGVETVAAEQRLGVAGKPLNLAPAEAYPALAVAYFIPLRDDDRAFFEVFGREGADVIPTGPCGQRA